MFPLLGVNVIDTDRFAPKIRVYNLDVKMPTETQLYELERNRLRVMNSRIDMKIKNIE